MQHARDRRFVSLLALGVLTLGASSPLAGGGEGDGSVTPVAPPPVINGGVRWGAEYFPNVPLVTHEGKTVHFFDDLLRDKVVSINFIYTSCPDACPLETAKLTEVYSLLGDRVGKDVFMYSISIDPERDTPEVLREYAERYQVGPGWLFLTGKAADIKLIRRKLGMIRTGEEALSDHTLSLMIGNQTTGQWMKRSPMENPRMLATQIGSWLHNWKDAPDPSLDYKLAPKLRPISRGEDLFRTRCSACHLVGPEDGILRQGPNLLGVTERRDRAWLARWLAEPDTMLAEGDPLALELFDAYRNLPMPNLRLTGVEVDALLEFMASESAYYLGTNASADEEAMEVDDSFDMEPSRPPCCEKREGLVLDDLDEDEAGTTGAAPIAAPAAAPATAPDELPEPAAPLMVRAPERRPAADGLPPSALLLSLALVLALGSLAFMMGRGPND